MEVNGSLVSCRIWDNVGFARSHILLWSFINYMAHWVQHTRRVVIDMVHALFNKYQLIREKMPWLTLIQFLYATKESWFAHPQFLLASNIKVLSVAPVCSSSCIALASSCLGQKYHVHKEGLKKSIIKNMSNICSFFPLLNALNLLVKLFWL